MANLKEKCTDPLSQRRQAHNSVSFNVSQNLTFKDNKALVLGWPKSSFGFLVKIKDTFFIFTKNFVERIQSCIPLASAIFQETL